MNYPNEFRDFCVQVGQVLPLLDSLKQEVALLRSEVKEVRQKVINEERKAIRNDLDGRPSPFSFLTPEAVAHLRAEAEDGSPASAPLPVPSDLPRSPAGTRAIVDADDLATMFGMSTTTFYTDPDLRRLRLRNMGRSARWFRSEVILHKSGVAVEEILARRGVPGGEGPANAGDSAGVV